MADDAAESDDTRHPSATDSDAHNTDGDRWTSDDWEPLNRTDDFAEPEPESEPDADADGGVDNIGHEDTEADTNVGRNDTATDNSVGRDEIDDEYRVPLDLSGDESEVDDEGDAGDDEDDDSHTPEPRSTPIESGDPTLENAIFVFLGAVVMILVLFRVMSLPL